MQTVRCKVDMIFKHTYNISVKPPGRGVGVAERVQAVRSLSICFILHYLQ